MGRTRAPRPFMPGQRLGYGRGRDRAFQAVAVTLGFILLVAIACAGIAAHYLP